MERGVVRRGSPVMVGGEDGIGSGGGVVARGVS